MFIAHFSRTPSRGDTSQFDSPAGNPALWHAEICLDIKALVSFLYRAILPESPLSECDVAHTVCRHPHVSLRLCWLGCACRYYFTYLRKLPPIGANPKCVLEAKVAVEFNVTS